MGEKKNLLRTADGIKNFLKKKKTDVRAVEDLYQIPLNLGRDDPDARELNNYIRQHVSELLRSKKLSIKDAERMFTQLGRSLLFASQYDVDAYFQYLEWDRKPQDRFYLPRRPQLMVMTKSLQDLFDDKLDVLSCSMPPGVGKAQPLWSKIATPRGFESIGRLKVGDRIFTADGSVTTVKGVYDFEEKEIVKVIFDDGAITHCSVDHLWEFETADGDTKVETIDEIMRRKDVHDLKFPLPKPVQFRDINQKCGMYAFGVLLSGYGQIFDDEVRYQNIPDELIKDISLDLYGKDTVNFYKINRDVFMGVKSNNVDRKIGGYAPSNQLEYAKKHKLTGVYNELKFIPEGVKRTSVENRMSLIQGIADGCGSVNDEGVARVRVASRQLAEDILEVIRSLGGKGTIDLVDAVKEVKPKAEVLFQHWEVKFGFPYEVEVFRAKKNMPPHRQSVDYRQIYSVEYHSKEPCRCIKVADKSELYVTDDYIVTHNTTLEIFYISMIAGLYPLDSCLVSAHAGYLTESIYDGVLSIMTDSEYNYRDIFPNAEIVRTNSKKGAIDLVSPRRFQTVTCRSIDGQLTGSTRCRRLLCADDLVSGIEEAMNINRLNKLWSKYYDDLRTRKLDFCKELHIATRWSVHDVIGRLERMYEGNDRARFIALPALDENDESNFIYDYDVGFSTKYYHDMRSGMDEISWKSLYMNEPIEREGLLYHEDELRRYFELPEEEPDAIISICDTKDKGTDYCFAPVAYVYGDDYYIEDCVCSNALPGMVESQIVTMYLTHSVQMSRFESNSAGGRIADDIHSAIKSRGGITHITKKFSKGNKETRIIVNNQWVKDHCLFRDKNNYRVSSDYGKMMTQLLSYTVAGNNPNDDVADGMAQFSEFAQSMSRKTVHVFQRPF